MPAKWLYSFTSSMTSAPPLNLSFAVRQLGLAQTGVMITASIIRRNIQWVPKLYWDDGAQFYLPHDENVDQRGWENFLPSTRSNGRENKENIIRYRQRYRWGIPCKTIKTLSLSTGYASASRKDLKIVYIPFTETGRNTGSGGYWNALVLWVT